MQTELRIGVALLVLAGAGGYFFMNRGAATAEREARTQSASTLPVITVAKEDTEKLTKLEFRSPGKEAIVLEKKGDAWELTAPIAAKANKADIKSLLDSLKDLKTSDVIDRTAAGYVQYEVDDKKGIGFTAYKGQDKALDLVFGTAGTRGQMVRVAGTEGIFVAQGYQSFLFTKEAKGWRDKSILEFEDVNVASVDIENENGKFTFVKNGDNWTGAFKSSGKKSDDKKSDDKEAAKKDGEPKKADAKKDEKKDGEAKKADAKDDKPAKPKNPGWEDFDGKKVEDMLRALKKLSAIDFADKDADTGTSEGAAKITITFKDGTTMVLLAGKTQKGQNRFVKKPDDETVWVITDYAAGWIVGDKAKFEPTPAGAAPPMGGHGDLPEMPDFDLPPG